MIKDELKVTDLNNLKVGDFVRYEAYDNVGFFTYTGEVIGLDQEINLVQFLTFEGTIGIILNEEEKLYHSKTKPKGWAKFKKDPSDKVVRVEKSTPIKTQKEKIFDLVKNNPKKKAASLLKQAKKEIGGNLQLMESQITLALIQVKR